tara:strand:+ start:590 stop:877 length:288 start_codon:yes stop_codon:yes gene_type:complete
MNRIKDMLWVINKALGYETSPYFKDKNNKKTSWGDVKMVPNIGTFYVEKVKLGYSLNQIERGGSREIIIASSLKILEPILIGMEKGINAFENKLK